MKYDLMLLYTTVATYENALVLSQSAVRNRVAACVNIIPAITAVYEWEGVVQQIIEVGILFKTMPENVGALKDFLRASHPYTTPALIAWTATCNDDFAKFLQKGAQ